MRWLGAFLTFRLQNPLYLPATVSGGTIWEVWLYDELSLGPVAGLAVTLLLGYGGLLLALAMWRRRHQVA